VCSVRAKKERAKWPPETEDFVDVLSSRLTSSIGPELVPA
jgi:hypothetical protein